MVIKALEEFFQLERKRINLLAISSNPPTNLDEPIAKSHIFVLQKSLEILKRPNTFYGQTVFLPNFSYNLKKIYRFTQKYNNQKNLFALSAMVYKTYIPIKRSQ